MNSLLAFEGLIPALDVFDFLLRDEFPEGRSVLLVREAVAEIRDLPRSPGEEDPDVSSREQVMALLRHYTLNGRMRPGRDYTVCDRRLGLWKWKTRTVRLAGLYFGSADRFVVAHAAFARGLKRGGKAITEHEKTFARTAAARLEGLGLLERALRIKDPHDGTA